jgi:S-adenosylmethionine decarboxylase
MKNLKPEIHRERLIVEGFYKARISENFLKNFLIGISKILGMKVIAGPFIFSPDKFSLIHHGIGGFMAWAESGVAFYSWNKHKFFTLDVYSCKPLDAQLLLEYVKKRLKCNRIGWQKLEYDNI